MDRCLSCMELFDEEFGICPYCGYQIGTPVEEAIHLTPGTILNNRYTVGRVLGYGGYGVTYAGWDNQLQQKVAIKEYLPTEFCTRMPGHAEVVVFSGEKQEQFYSGMEKFLDEARKLTKFQDEPGIIHIFNSFEANYTAYLVEEFLEGETLASYLNKVGTMPEDIAIGLLLPLMNSLEAVHQAGLLHRDIAPENIFLTSEGEAKLIDFGASRYATTAHSRSLTVIIKPGYSPEEQYRSRGDQGPWTDVYSIAATLYKMVTGVTPPDALERRAMYEGKSKDILKEAKRINKNISRVVDVAILNAMNVRVEDRTKTIPAFLEELTAVEPAKRVYGKIKKIDLYAWPAWLKVSIGTAIFGAITTVILLATGIISFSEKDPSAFQIPSGIVMVPNVEGSQYEDALEDVHDENLLCAVDGNVLSDYIQAGEVVYQKPAGGNFASINSNVSLVISVGDGTVLKPIDGVATVPYVISYEKDEAINRLLEAGLSEPEIEEEESNAFEAGMVMACSETAFSQVPEGTVVTIVVCSGPKPVKMPDVEDMKLADAAKILNESGILYTTQTVTNDDVPRGYVISQSVKANKSIYPGTEVQLLISGGKNVIEVPNVVGKSQSEAETILLKAKFEVNIKESYDDKVPEGDVITQDPKGGSGQLSGSTITIVVSKGQQPLTVSFEANGGTLSGSSSKTVYHSDKYRKLPTASRTGYDFLGWYTSSSGGDKVSENTTVEITSDHTLYAHWQQTTFTVTFDANGGSVGVQSKKVTYGGTYGDLPTPSRNGYAFNGWFTSASGGSQVSSNSTVSGTSNHTLYAHWSRTTLTVSFDANGGSCGTSSKSVTIGQTYGDLPTPTRTGYNFNGWFTSASGGSQVNSGTSVDANSAQKLYAHWTAVGYTVSWSTSGYSVSVNRTSSPVGGSTGNLSNGATIYYGDVLSISYSANSGYTITSTGATSVTVTGNVNSSMIYANVNASTYTYTVNITYKSINGTNLGSETKTLTGTYGSEQLITPKGFTGYSTPFSENLHFDTASNTTKNITFTYYPSATTATTSKSGTIDSGMTLNFNATVTTKRTGPTTYTVQVTWTTTMSNKKYLYNGFALKVNGNFTRMKKYDASSYGAGWTMNGSTYYVTKTTDTYDCTIGKATDTTSTIDVYWYQINLNNTDLSGSGYCKYKSTWTIDVPAW